MNDWPTWTCDEHGTENTLAEGCQFCRVSIPKTESPVIQPMQYSMKHVMELIYRVPRGRSEMTKPDWKDAPEWARWTAMDPDGHWYWFEQQPSYVDEEWCEGGRFAKVDFSKGNGTLEKRP